VLRAAHKVAERLLWRTEPGGETGDGLTFYNPVDMRSFAEAWLRRSARMSLRRGDTKELERDLAALDDPSIKVDWRENMEPGGSGWCHVEIELCRRSGDHARADELEAKCKAEAKARFERWSAPVRAYLEHFRLRRTHILS
jgi:hypothetical protein